LGASAFQFHQAPVGERLGRIEGAELETRSITRLPSRLVVWRD
jgi:hypothetical protein